MEIRPQKWYSSRFSPFFKYWKNRSKNSWKWSAKNHLQITMVLGTNSAKVTLYQLQNNFFGQYKAIRAVLWHFTKFYIVKKAYPRGIPGKNFSPRVSPFPGERKKSGESSPLDRTRIFWFLSEQDSRTTSIWISRTVFLKLLNIFRLSGSFVQGREWQNKDGVCRNASIEFGFSQYPIACWFDDVALCLS